MMSISYFAKAFFFSVFEKRYSPRISAPLTSPFLCKTLMKLRILRHLHMQNVVINFFLLKKFFQLLPVVFVSRNLRHNVNSPKFKVPNSIFGLEPMQKLKQGQRILASRGCNDHSISVLNHSKIINSRNYLFLQFLLNS